MVKQNLQPHPVSPSTSSCSSSSERNPVTGWLRSTENEDVEPLSLVHMSISMEPQPVVHKTQPQSSSALFEEKSQLFQLHDMSVVLEDLQGNQQRLLEQANLQNEQIQQLKAEKTKDQAEILKLAKERVELERRCLLTEQALAKLEDGRTKLQRVLNDTVEEKEMWQSKCQTLQEVCNVMEHDAKQNHLQSIEQGRQVHEDRKQLAMKLEQLEDSHERLKTQSHLQQSRIQQLEDDLERSAAKAMSQDTRHNLLQGIHQEHQSHASQNKEGDTVDNPAASLVAESVIMSLMAKVESLEELLSHANVKLQRQTDTIAQLITKTSTGRS